MKDNRENDSAVINGSESEHGSRDDPKDRKRKLTSPSPNGSTDDSSPSLKTTKSVTRDPYEFDDDDAPIAAFKRSNDQTVPLEQHKPNVMNDSENNEDLPACSKATFRYVVQNLSKLKGRRFSKSFVVRALSWKILIGRWARASADSSPVRFLAVFLQCEGVPECDSWACRATLEFRLLSQKENGENYIKACDHTFHSAQDDWGFGEFAEWDYVTNPENGYMKDDSITLEVKLTAEAPGFWNPRKCSSHVGLKNQGATCYMNSLLQVLFFTNALRKAVYEIPTESEFVQALQRVFYDLQFCEEPADTKKLTGSFGWNTCDLYVQHDVQEFLRKLLDHIEEKMKGTCVAGAVPKLFEGKMVSFVKCKSVDYNSSKSETFYDIQLNVKGKKNLYESFGEYVAKETLDGDNRYDAGQYGLQEAEKGVIFSVFPPVLHLHLMRFQYDPVAGSSEKFSDRFEFSEKISLNQYLQSPEATPADFTLQAVLVHSGDNDRSHYVAFIDPKLDGNWCKFDDETVSQCTKSDAIENNFGGNEGCPTAYMLVYIRDSEIPSVLFDVTEDDIPREILMRLQNFKAQDLKKIE